MAKFKVLEKNQALMSKMGIYSHNLTEPTNEFFQSFATYFVLILLVAFVLIGGVVFAFNNSSDFKIILETFVTIIGGAQCGGMFLSIGLNMKKVKKLHLKLQQIVDEAIASEEDDVIAIYWDNEQKCRKFTERISFFIVINQGVFGAIFVYSIVGFFSKNFEISSIDLPVKFAVPFDTTTIFGWYTLWLIQSNIGLAYSASVVAGTSYFMCCCIYLCSICDHFELIIQSRIKYIGLASPKKNNDQKAYEENRQLLSQAVDIHNNIFDVFQLVADISSGTIFALLPINAVLMGISMYNLEHTDFSIESFGFQMLCIIASLSWPYMFCKFATIAIERIVSIGDIAYGSNWYEYPPGLQKYILLIIVRSQKPIYFNGFKLIRCNLEVLGELLKSSISYYVIFRELSQH